MAKKRLSFVDKIKAERVTTRRCPSWFERLSEGSEKDELRALHREYKAGNIKHSVAYLRQRISDELKVDTGRSGLENWLRRDTPDG